MIGTTIKNREAELNMFRTRALIADLPRCVAGQNMPCVQISGLPETVKGVWSLWEITLSADDFSRRRFLPVFIEIDDGR